jgi:hypothetical protein
MVPESSHRSSQVNSCMKSRVARGNHRPHDKLVNTTPIPLDSHVDGHTKVYFLIAINEGIASKLLARNHRRISMAHVMCMNVTVPIDGRNKFVQYK